MFLLDSKTEWRDRFDFPIAISLCKWRVSQVFEERGFFGIDSFLCKKKEKLHALVDFLSWDQFCYMYLPGLVQMPILMNIIVIY